MNATMTKFLKGTALTAAALTTTAALTLATPAEAGRGGNNGGASGTDGGAGAAEAAANEAAANEAAANEAAANEAAANEAAANEAAANEAAANEAAANEAAANEAAANEAAANNPGGYQGGGTGAPGTPGTGAGQDNGNNGSRGGTPDATGVDDKGDVTVGCSSCPTDEPERDGGERREFECVITTKGDKGWVSNGRNRVYFKFESMGVLQNNSREKFTGNATYAKACVKQLAETIHHRFCQNYGADIGSMKVGGTTFRMQGYTCSGSFQQSSQQSSGVQYHSNGITNQNYTGGGKGATRTTVRTAPVKPAIPNTLAVKTVQPTVSAKAFAHAVTSGTSLSFGSNVTGTTTATMSVCEPNRELNAKSAVLLPKVN